MISFIVNLHNLEIPREFPWGIVYLQVAYAHIYGRLY